MRDRKIRHVLVLSAVFALVLLGGAARAEVRESISFTARDLVLENVLGEIRVEPHAGDGFQVEIAILGRDASPGKVRIEARHEKPARLTLRFPFEESSSFVYPRLDSGATTTIRSDSDSWLSRIFGGGSRVQARGSGSGLELWADATVRVPEGARLHVIHGVGDVGVEGVEGAIGLDVRHGGVRVADLTGDLSVDVGSGTVDLVGVRGRVLVDTGSGHVRASGVSGPSVSVDTGSGGVELDSVECDRLTVDTGSGRVRASAVRAAGASIDTGSGSVELDLVETGPGPYRVDTGSGSIVLRLPATASVHVSAETGSGTIRTGIEDARVVRRERTELELRIGAGAARVELDTGSGGIRIDPAR